MAAEDIGAIYNTKVPSLADPADIQDAIKLYHYGSISYNPNNTNPALLPNPSLAYHLNNIQDQIDGVLDSGIGSEYNLVRPISPDDGFVWMDADSSVDNTVIYTTAIYSNDQPTENLADGMVWIDKDSPLKETFVWDSFLSQWIRINDFETVLEGKGDLLVGTGDSNLTSLVAGQDGYTLTARSSEPSGLAWEQTDIQSFEVSSIMGVY
jgi:hypothetical protein